MAVVGNIVDIGIQTAMKFAFHRHGFYSDPAFGLTLILMAMPVIAQNNSSFIQADVYNALYEAHAHCDENLEQSRSEFITAMFERYRDNTVTMDLLKTLITHSQSIARRQIAEEEREHEILSSSRQAVPIDGYANPDDVRKLKEHQKALDALEESLDSRRKQAEVNDCVVETLWKS